MPLCVVCGRVSLSWRRHQTVEAAAAVRNASNSIFLGKRTLSVELEKKKEVAKSLI